MQYIEICLGQEIALQLAANMLFVNDLFGAYVSPFWKLPTILVCS